MSQVASRALRQLLLGACLALIVSAALGAFDAPAPSRQAHAEPLPATQENMADQRQWALVLGLLVFGLSVNARRRR